MEFEVLSTEEAMECQGGLLAGALTGAIIGGTAGLIIATGKGIVTHSLTGNQIWKCYTSCAIAGAAVGTYFPV